MDDLQILQQGDPAARAWAAARLAGDASPAAVPALVTALGDVDGDVRLAAVFALGTRHAGAACFPLLALRDDRYLNLADWVAWALREGVVEAAQTAVTAGLLAHDVAAMVAAGYVPVIFTEAIRQAWPSWLANPDPAVRRQAVSLSPGNEALVAMLQDADGHVRTAAARVLGFSGDGMEAVMAAAVSPDPAIRATAVAGLDWHGPDVVTAIARACADNDPRVRTEGILAVERLSKYADLDYTPDFPAELIPMLYAACVDCSDARRCASAVRALTRLEDTTLPARVLDLLHAPAYTVREAAVEAMSLLCHPASIWQAVRPLATDAVPEVRRAVLNVLHTWPSANIEALALDRLQHDPVAEIRAHAASLLGEMEDTCALPALIAAVQDADPQVRRDALAALEMDPATLRSAACAALRDPAAVVRMQAAESLCGMADAYCLPALAEATHDPCLEVRRWAVEATCFLHTPQARLVLQEAANDPVPQVRQRAQAELDRPRQGEERCDEAFGS